MTRAEGPPAPLPLPPPWLETLRLDLREFVPADLPDLARLDADPRVPRRFVRRRGGQPPDLRTVIRRVIRNYQIYPGLGTWWASRRDTGERIGWFTFKYVPRTIEIEIGYRLYPEAWGQGFATEGARELVRYGFDDLGLERIIGVTHPDNVASQRVLHKAGLCDEGWGRYYGRRLRLFVARRDGWPPAACAA